MRCFKGVVYLFKWTIESFPDVFNFIISMDHFTTTRQRKAWHPLAGGQS